MRENREFIDVQQAVMILVSAGELHFEKSKYLILRDRIRCRDRFHIVLYRHDNTSAGLNALASKAPRIALTSEGSIDLAV